MNKTKIQYLTHSWNPTSGCSGGNSKGCANCWARDVSKRFDLGFDPTCHPGRLDEPLRRKIPSRIGVSFRGDLFDAAIPFEFIAAVWGVMRAAHWHTFVVLTKNPERMAEFFAWLGSEPCVETNWQALRSEVAHHPKGDGGPIHTKYCADCDGPWPPPNIWGGVSACTQADLDRNVPRLLKCSLAVRLVSLEPLIEAVDFEGAYHSHLRGWAAEEFPSGHPEEEPEMRAVETGRKLDLVIVGAESGPNRRPMDLDWVRSVRDQCQDAAVPLFFKQSFEHGQRWEEQRDEIDGLRAEADLMRRWLDDFEAETRALPAQHEHKGRGASSYNWRMWFVGLARAAYIRAQGESAD